jgi:hypothetical protein
MKIREQLEQSLARFTELEGMMSDPEILAGEGSKMATIMREHGGLSKVATKYRRYKKLAEDLRELAPMLEAADPDEKAMATEEAAKIKSERDQIWNELLELSVGGEDATLRLRNSRRDRWRRSRTLRTRPVRNVSTIRRNQKLESRDHGLERQRARRIQRNHPLDRRGWCLPSSPI